MAIMFKWLKALAEYVLKVISVWPCVHVCFRKALKEPGSFLLGPGEVSSTWIVLSPWLAAEQLSELIVVLGASVI